MTDTIWYRTQHSIKTEHPKSPNQNQSVVFWTPQSARPFWPQSASTSTIAAITSNLHRLCWHQRNCSRMTNRSCKWPRMDLERSGHIRWQEVNAIHQRLLCPSTLAWWGSHSSKVRLKHRATAEVPRIQKITHLTPSLKNLRVRHRQTINQSHHSVCPDTFLAIHTAEPSSLSSIMQHQFMFMQRSTYAS